MSVRTENRNQASSKQRGADQFGFGVVEGGRPKFHVGQSDIPQLMNFDDAWFAQSQKRVRVVPNRLSTAIVILTAAGTALAVGMAVLAICRVL